MGNLRKTNFSKSQRGGALLDLLLTSKKELVQDVKVKSSLGCSEHVVASSLERNARVDFRRADFYLLVTSELDVLGNPRGKQRGPGELGDVPGQLLGAREQTRDSGGCQSCAERPEGRHAELTAPESRHKRHKREREKFRLNEENNCYCEGEQTLKEEPREVDLQP